MKLGETTVFYAALHKESFGGQCLFGRFLQQILYFDILSKGFCVKNCDASLRSVVFKFDGIALFIQIIQTYEKYIINEL